MKQWINSICNQIRARREPTPRERFARCLEIVLRHEGGFVNHPRDPGGMTNLGVTRRVWEEWTGQPATEEDMRALTPAQVEPVYLEWYWNPVRGDELPAGVDLVLFDFGVNAGPARAARMVQTLVGVRADGIIGPITLGAIRQANYQNLIHDMEIWREDYYQGLSTFGVFGRGWINRTRDVTEHALNML